MRFYLQYICGCLLQLTINMMILAHNYPCCTSHRTTSFTHTTRTDLCWHSHIQPLLFLRCSSSHLWENTMLNPMLQWRSRLQQPTRNWLEDNWCLFLCQDWLRKLPSACFPPGALHSSSRISIVGMTLYYLWLPENWIHMDNLIHVKGLLVLVYFENTRENND